MACGMDAQDGLGAGAFNEADSHKSILEALNEWRQGSNPTQNPGDPGGDVSISGVPG